MASLKIYRASAGAGKTHTLTHEYLRLALEDRLGLGYQRIQAVTFTNKATGEMKERILHELWAMARASGQDSPFLSPLARELEISEAEVQRRAELTLRRILLDYTSFRISTIDAFFQEILRSFARELGLQGGFRIDMEAELALNRAVDAVLVEQDTLSGQEDAKRWLREFSQASLEAGEGYDIRKSLRRLSRYVLNESVRKMIQEQTLPTRTDLAKLKQYLSQIQTVFSQGLAMRASAILKTFEQFGVGFDKLSYSRAGGVGGTALAFPSMLTTPRAALAWLRRGGGDAPSRFVSACKDILTMFKADIRTSLQQDLLEEMQGQMQLLHSFIQESFVDAYSASVALAEISSYGLITDINAKLHEGQSSAGSMLLADAPSLIYGILRDPGASGFIYEKVGTRIDHQMIDEFQDTSQMQYLNFLPLIRDGLASGYDSLVVGDVKQSIYRWRGSDSSLLGKHIEGDFGDGAELITLEENWRSTPEVITFNNELYQDLAEQLRDDFTRYIDCEASTNSLLASEALQDLPQLFTDYYEDVHQQVPPSRADQVGLVAVHHATRCDREEALTAFSRELGSTSSISSIAYQLPRTIVSLQKRGYKPEDIAILVRKGREAQLIAQILDEATLDTELTEGGRYSLGYISEEALRIGSAISVSFVVALMRCIAFPHDPVARWTALEISRQLSELAEVEPMAESELFELSQLGKRSLYETIEMLIGRYDYLFLQGEQPYLIAFLDLALGYQQDLSVDIMDFLSMWDETGCNKTLRIAEQEDKISLMTIHKSKGLGFPVVLLPLPTWDLQETVGLGAQYLWCPSPYTGLFPEVHTLPVQLGEKLMQTYFAPSYLRERVSIAMDALNLLYVATTRAKQELHLWIFDNDKEVATNSSPKGRGNDFEPYKKISTPLALFLAKRLDLALHIEAEEDEMTYTYPQGSYRHKDNKAGDTLVVKHIQSARADERIAILRQGLQHFEENKQRRYGSLMHHLLDQVERLEQLPSLLEQAERMGLIPTEQREEVHSDVLRMFAKEEAERWFDGSGEILRECAIVGGGIAQQRRPDRVIIYPDNHVEVVDYKFGQPRRKYEQQVREYMALISQMGYTSVCGYLWYVTQDKIEEVSQVL